MVNWNNRALWVHRWVHTCLGLTPAHGLISAVNYLLNHRLQWGKPDTLSLLASALDKLHHSARINDQLVATTLMTSAEVLVVKDLPPVSPNAPEYFCMDIPAEYVSIIQNDWPYSGMFG